MPYRQAPWYSTEPTAIVRDTWDDRAEPTRHFPRQEEIFRRVYRPAFRFLHRPDDPNPNVILWLDG